MENVSDKVCNSIVGYGQKIFDLVYVSILWLICCIPIVTIGTATTALYYTVNKVLIKEKGYLSKDFFNSFKKNLKQGILLWMSILVASVLLHINSSIMSVALDGEFSSAASVFYNIIDLLLVGIFLFQFTALSRFNMPTGWFIKIGYFSIRHHVMKSILLIGAMVGCFYLVFYMPLLIFILPGVFCLLFNRVIESVLIEYMPIRDLENVI